MRKIDQWLKRHPCPGCLGWTQSPLCRLCHQACRAPAGSTALMSDRTESSRLIRLYRQTGNRYVERWLLQRILQRIHSASTTWTTLKPDPLLDGLITEILRQHPQSARLAPKHLARWPLACRVLLWHPEDDFPQSPLIQAVTIQGD